MIRFTVKLRPSKRQRAELERWLWHLTDVYNWTLRQVDLGHRDHRTPTLFDLKAKTNGCGRVIGVPKDIVDGTIAHAYRSWERCFNRFARKPRMKGSRNRLSSLEIRRGALTVAPGRVSVPGLRDGMRYFRRPGIGLIDVLGDMPPERLRGSRILKRSSGWYLSVIVDTEPLAITPTGAGEVGIDLGYATLATLSTGEKVAHPQEWRRSLERIARAQRGRNRKLTARLRERQANRVKDRNHKLSRRLVAENAVIVVSKDNVQGLQRSGWGRSVAGAAHAQLRSMLAYKCRAGGRQYVETNNRNSTRACSACGAIAGPCGRAGLKVRRWVCSACGAEHDRDVNAAINTLRAGAGRAHEGAERRVRNRRAERPDGRHTGEVT